MLFYLSVVLRCVLWWWVVAWRRPCLERSLALGLLLLVLDGSSHTYMMKQPTQELIARMKTAVAAAEEAKVGRAGGWVG